MSPVVALQADWAIRTVTAIALAAAGLTDESYEIDQLPEMTCAMFSWPGLVDRANRVLSVSAAALLELFLAEHRTSRRELLHSELEALIACIGQDAADLFDDIRIAAGSWQVVNRAYRTAGLAAQLLHLRHGPGGRPVVALRDQVTTSLWELQSLLERPSSASVARCSGRTLRPLQVWVPGPGIQ